MPGIHPMKIPHYETLKRRRLKSGNCLNHCRVLTDLGENPYRVAMGELQLGGPSDYRHCWLESDVHVVDLTHCERFFERADYYSRMQPQNVRCFSVREVAENMLASDGVEFWGFTPQPESTTADWRAWQRSISSSNE